MTMYTYNAVCVSVHDGDTVTLNVDLGFDTWHIGSFRLLGCNARELAEPGGVEARVNLDTMLMGLDLTVDTVKSDKFGPRYDAYLYLGGVSVVDTLIATGWAITWNGKGVKPVPPWPRVGTLH